MDLHELRRKGAAAEGWPPPDHDQAHAEQFEGPPIPLEAHAAPPLFPTEALPQVLGEFVRQLATATQTPEDLAGGLVLAAVASVLAKRVGVDVKPGWHEPPNLFVLVAMLSGERKSAVFRAVMEPIAQRQAELVETAGREARALEAQRKVAEDQARAASRKARSGDIAETADATEAHVRAMSIEIPASPTLVTADATPEVIPVRLAENDGRLLIAAPEGGIFSNLSRWQKTGVPHMEALLKGHAGDDIRVDRVSRPAIVVREAQLSLALAVQPEVLEKIGESEGFRGLGLLARFLYALPETRLGRRGIDPPPVEASVEAAYRARLLELLTTPPGADLQLSDAATDQFHAFRTELEPRLKPDVGDLAEINDWASKLPGAVIRIASGLHMAYYGTAGTQRDIDQPTITNAITLGRYYLQHALTAFSAMGDQPDMRIARRVLSWTERHALDQFSVRDAARGLKTSSLRQNTDLKPALALLVAHGYISETQPKHYSVNPAFAQRAAHSSGMSGTPDPASRARAREKLVEHDGSSIKNDIPSPVGHVGHASHAGAHTRAHEEPPQMPDMPDITHSENLPTGDVSPVPEELP